MGNISARELREVLLAHAAEIANVAASAPEDALVLAVVHDDGRWLGAQVVAADSVRSADEMATSEEFYVPAACRTPEQVRQFISEAISEEEDA